MYLGLFAKLIIQIPVDEGNAGVLLRCWGRLAKMSHYLTSLKKANVIFLLQLSPRITSTNGNRLSEDSWSLWSTI